MRLLNIVKEYSKENHDKKIAMFVDMDGVIADFSLDINNDISLNAPEFFLNLRPLQTVIDQLAEINQIPNIDLYILSACQYKTQAEEKATWLKKHAPFFKVDNQIFVVKEVVNYTRETKSDIKTNNIKEIMQYQNYDLAIYLEDEYPMLKKAYLMLNEKILCIHISNIID